MKHEEKPTKSIEETNTPREEREVSNHKSEKHTVERRTFLKKMAYAPPTLIVLGQLLKPESAHADSAVPPPPPIW